MCHRDIMNHRDVMNHRDIVDHCNPRHSQSSCARFTEFSSILTANFPSSCGIQQDFRASCSLWEWSVLSWLPCYRCLVMGLQTAFRPPVIRLNHMYRSLATPVLPLRTVPQRGIFSPGLVFCWCLAHPNQISTFLNFCFDLSCISRGSLDNPT